MGILDIFSPKPAPAPTANEGPTDPNTVQPTVPAPATPEPTKAPLDEFKALWETDPKSGETKPQSLFEGLDPQKVFESASKANFASAITPEMQAAIQAGGDGAQVAFSQAINAATQAAFAQSTIVAQKLIEQAINKTNADNMAALPNLVKQHTAMDSLHTKNPALSNPAAAPIIKAIQAQLAVKHPDATASQLEAMATDYLDNFAEVVKPTKTAKVTSETKAGDTDWSKFLGE